MIRLSAVRRRVALTTAVGLVWLPARVWRRLPRRLRLWTVDQRMWSYTSLHERYRSPSAMRRTLNALDPGGV